MDAINTYASSRRRSPRRSAVEVIVVVVSLALIVAAFAYALSWTGQADSVATDPAPSPTTAGQEPQTPSETPTTDVADTSEVGQTRIGTNADTTVLQAKKVLPPADRAPSPGEEWFGVRAEICMHDDANAPSGELPWSSWTVRDAEGGEYTGSPALWDDYPAQQLPTTPIQPGSCSLGWVLIGVPKGASQRIERVEFGSGDDPAAWVV